MYRIPTATSRQLSVSTLRTPGFWYAGSMLDWPGSLRLREHTPMRVVLSLSLTTRVVGALILLAGLYLVFEAWEISPWLAALPAVLVVAGMLLATLSRRLVFDREAGVLRVNQRILFAENRTVVPLFHLRAVVIIARPPGGPASMGLHSRYIAYVERRVGDSIYLDESRRCATLLKMAEAIAEVAEVRLEYDAMSQVGE